jgi:hypothetical protein
MFALILTYILAHLAIKASILMFYRTIFTFVVVPFKYAWLAVFAYVVLNAIAGILVLCLQCRPMNYTWNEPKGIKGKCDNLTTTYIATGALVALADLMLLILPMPVLWKLRIPRKDKLMLCGVFALGSL